ncbi:MAG: NAD-dependent protein deacylase [Bacteroidetes bacterium]|nr:NAD-dependent protein deacylase [Bacteroidota bacterium]
MLEIDKLKEIVSTARRIVAFTGAGISAESGIPTYRGDDGVWHKYDPNKYANIHNFLKDPQYYWNFFKEVRYPVIKKAKPNKAHIALARLEENGKLEAVITQNIDDLHQLAGSKRILELHGNTRRISCLNCKKQHTMDEVYSRLETQLPPLCSECSGILKPEVVFFGESLPVTVLEEAINVTNDCDLFLAIGSSLVVQPAASLPFTAKEKGAKLIIINKDATPLDTFADIVFHTTASEVLDKMQ